MNHLAILTVGKTHSGKTSFAKKLETKMPNSLVIDQDAQAEFLHIYYQKLIPEKGPNIIKNKLTKLILDYAVEETSSHIILSNANRSYDNRKRLLDYFQEKGFMTALVHFAIPDVILEQRIANSHRNPAIIRTASSFDHVLASQQAEDKTETVLIPTSAEATHLYTVKNDEEIDSVIHQIIAAST